MVLKWSVLEFFLVECVVWLAVWLIDDYVATLLTLLVGAVVLAVLVVALLSEAIERSNVPRKYYQVMAVSVAAPLAVALLYAVVFKGLDWLTAR
jgi:hypothetical protein